MTFNHPPLPDDDAPYDDPDNPEWTEEDFARAKAFRESLPPEDRARFEKGIKVRDPAFARIMARLEEGAAHSRDNILQSVTGPGELPKPRRR